MAEPCGSLSIAEIAEINKKAIENFGGSYSSENMNLRNRGSLEIALEAIHFPIYGEMLYKTLFDKIAAIVHTIVCKHVFIDGNKRTGMAVCLAMLKMNGYEIDICNDTEDYFVFIASNNTEIADIAEWLKITSRTLK